MQRAFAVRIVRTREVDSKPRFSDHELGGAARATGRHLHEFVSSSLIAFSFPVLKCRGAVKAIRELQ
jgi:hypothetical protein